MRKLLVLLLAAVMVFSFAGCGSSGSTAANETAEEVKATITDNDGETVEMTAAEIDNIYTKHESVYKEKYFGAKVSVDVTVDEVKYNAATEMTDLNMITTKEGWTIYVISEYFDKYMDMLELEEGDRIHVESTLDGENQWNGSDMGDISVWSDGEAEDGTVITMLDE